MRVLLFAFTNTSISTNWSIPKPPGDYVITAVAYDRLGELGLSTAARVTNLLPVGYVAPSVEIVFPPQTMRPSPRIRRSR